MSIIVCDLDGTICTEEKRFSRSLAIPIKNVRVRLLQAQKAGHEIVIFTARGWEEYEMTKAWLVANDIPHDRLICGKPIGDIFIDDRSYKSVEDAAKSDKRLFPF